MRVSPLHRALGQPNDSHEHDIATCRGSHLLNFDADRGGIPDGEELALFANNATYIKDADNDKLTGYSYLGVWYGGQEATYGTDFNLSDTDADELDDWSEFLNE